MDWSEVTRSVVVEAVEAHPLDRVLDLGCGKGSLLTQLSPRIRAGIGVDSDPTVLEEARRGAPPNLSFLQEDIRQIRRFWPGDVSVVTLHDVFRLLTRDEQRRLLLDLGMLLPERGLLVLGDIVWSMPPEQLDEPEQYGENQGFAPSASELEGLCRAAGFLPDLHRFGPGRAVMIALRAPKG